MKPTENSHIEDVKTEQVMEAVENQPAAEAQPAMMDLPTAINTVIARTEATAIGVAIINAFLDVIQKRESALTADELAKIQGAINLETAKTDALYQEIEKVLAQAASPASEEDTSAE